MVLRSMEGLRLNLRSLFKFVKSMIRADIKKLLQHCERNIIPLVGTANIEPNSPYKKIFFFYISSLKIHPLIHRSLEFIHFIYRAIHNLKKFLPIYIFKYTLFVQKDFTIKILPVKREYRMNFRSQVFFYGQK